VLIAHINNLTRRHSVENGKATMLREACSFENNENQNTTQKPLQP
jgi:hypothetical protein